MSGKILAVAQPSSHEAPFDDPVCVQQSNVEGTYSSPPWSGQISGGHHLFSYVATS